eukprot:SAG11_NODE_1392_length_5048_cov_2.551020_1_plen_96_part_00
MPHNNTQVAWLVSTFVYSRHLRRLQGGHEATDHVSMFEFVYDDAGVSAVGCPTMPAVKPTEMPGATPDPEPAPDECMTCCLPFATEKLELSNFWR